MYLDGFIKGICDNEDCAGRGIELRVKNYRAESPMVFKCPLCGVQAIEVSFETWEHHQIRIEREARTIVNVQQKRAAKGFSSITDLFDESLTVHFKKEKQETA